MATPRGGRAIRARREELGLSQEEFARRLGEHVQAADIARLEAGGDANDVARLMGMARQQLETALATIWVLEVLLDDRSSVPSSDC